MTLFLIYYTQIKIYYIPSYSKETFNEIKLKITSYDNLIIHLFILYILFSSFLHSIRILPRTPSDICEHTHSWITLCNPTDITSNERPHFGHPVWPPPVHSSDFQAGYNGALRGHLALRRLTRKTTYGDDDDGHTTSDLPRSVVSDVYGRWLVRFVPPSLIPVPVMNGKQETEEFCRCYFVLATLLDHDSEQFCRGMRKISWNRDDKYAIFVLGDKFGVRKKGTNLATHCISFVERKRNSVKLVETGTFFWSCPCVYFILSLESFSLVHSRNIPSDVLDVLPSWNFFNGVSSRFDFFHCWNFFSPVFALLLFS